MDDSERIELLLKIRDAQGAMINKQHAELLALRELAQEAYDAWDKCGNVPDAMGNLWAALKQGGGVMVEKYYDQDGNEVSLHKLVRLEPDWACSRIKVGEEAIEQLQALREAAPRWQSIKETFEDIPKETSVLVCQDFKEPHWMTIAMLKYEDSRPFWSGWVWAQVNGMHHPNLIADDEYEFDYDYDYRYWHPLPALKQGEE